MKCSLLQNLHRETAYVLAWLILGTSFPAHGGQTGTPISPTPTPRGSDVNTTPSPSPGSSNSPTPSPTFQTGEVIGLPPYESMSWTQDFNTQLSAGLTPTEYSPATNSPGTRYNVALTQNLAPGNVSMRRGDSSQFEILRPAAFGGGELACGRVSFDRGRKFQKTCFFRSLASNPGTCGMGGSTYLVPDVAQAWTGSSFKNEINDTLPRVDYIPLRSYGDPEDSGVVAEAPSINYTCRLLGYADGVATASARQSNAANKLAGRLNTGTGKYEFINAQVAGNPPEIIDLICRGRWVDCTLEPLEHRYRYVPSGAGKSLAAKNTECQTLGPTWKLATLDSAAEIHQMRNYLKNFATPVGAPRLAVLPAIANSCASVSALSYSGIVFGVDCSGANLIVNWPKVYDRCEAGAGGSPCAFMDIGVNITDYPALCEDDSAVVP